MGPPYIHMGSEDPGRQPAVPEITGQVRQGRRTFTSGGGRRGGPRRTAPSLITNFLVRRVSANPIPWLSLEGPGGCQADTRRRNLSISYFEDSTDSAWFPVNQKHRRQVRLAWSSA